MLAAPFLLAFTLIPGLDPIAAAKLAQAIAILHRIEDVLGKVNSYAQRIRDVEAMVNPETIMAALPIQLKIPPELFKVYDEMKRTWVLAERVRGLVRVFEGDRIDRDEWHRILGEPVGLYGQEFAEYRDWSSVNRLNVIADRVKNGQRNQESAAWLLERARLGALRAGDQGSPGFSTRIAAMATAADGAIAAETGDTLLEMLKLDNERLMDKEKERRDRSRLSLGIYEDLSAASAAPGLP